MGCPCFAFHFIMDDASLERARLLRQAARSHGMRAWYSEFDDYHAIVVRVQHCRLREFCDELTKWGLVLHGIDVSTDEQKGIVEARGQRAHVTAWPMEPRWVGDRYPDGDPPPFHERRKMASSRELERNRRTEGKN